MRPVAAALLGSAALLAGCATAQHPDPLEPLNRKVFAFNEAVDGAVLKPVAQVYKAVLPSPIQLAVTNFFGNVKDAWSAVNLFMQGRFADGLSDVMRFGTNTVFGFAGVMDIATELGFERHGEDFGQTLGRWGVPSGAYIVWPILGPSTVRDSIGLPVDIMATPTSVVSVPLTRNTLTGLQLVSARAGVLTATGLIDDIALDKYAFVRNAYLQRRRSLVYDGNPPDEEEDTTMAPSAEPAASAPR
ncbi:MlaA family lipoprotein [Sphaerotilus sp.]|uniref:MlaA family lipoprotein n=1 Tax=Sphaerotilus sp. TaxID=2093942 RepID=UPI0025E14DDA|nr:VacJ family lipoprotein [Sphaerotilus sp.]